MILLKYLLNPAFLNTTFGSLNKIQCHQSLDCDKLYAMNFLKNDNLKNSNYGFIINKQQFFCKIKSRGLERRKEHETCVS